MNITDPSALHPARVERINAQDLGGIMSFAEPNGTFAPQPGLALTGSDNLAAQRQFLAFGLPITLTVRHTLVAGDVALVDERYRRRWEGSGYERNRRGCPSQGGRWMEARN